MDIELRILSGARAGEVRSFDQSVISIGRAPDSDLRFDAAADLDVSAHHARIRQSGSGFEIVDAGSRNGTLLNGRPIRGPHDLHTGDVITFGVEGPRASVRIPSRDAFAPVNAPAQEMGARTAQRVAVAVREQTTWLWRLLGAAVVLLLVVAGVGYLVHRHEASVSQAEITRLLAANQAAARAFQARLADAHDTALANEVRRRNETLAARARGGDRGKDGAASEPRVRSGAAGAALAEELARSNAAQHALADMDLPAVRQQNDSAIVLIAADLHGHVQQASGFCVSGSGVIVTNRHVVVDSSGRATRVAVKFANTREWRVARVLRVARDSTVDLALLQMTSGGPYPTVRGLSTSGVDAPVGSPIAALGFPPSDSSATAANDAVARTTFSTGTINRSLIGLLQIDAFAGRGSSGSPVFDRHDHVIGIVWGGLSSAGHIVYAVPSDRLLPLLPATIRDSVKRADAH